MVYKEYASSVRPCIFSIGSSTFWEQQLAKVLRKYQRGWSSHLLFVFCQLFCSGSGEVTCQKSVNNHPSWVSRSTHHQDYQRQHWPPPLLCTPSVAFEHHLAATESGRGWIAVDMYACMDMYIHVTINVVDYFSGHVGDSVFSATASIWHWTCLIFVQQALPVAEIFPWSSSSLYISNQGFGVATWYRDVGQEHIQYRELGR